MPSGNGFALFQIFGPGPISRVYELGNREICVGVNLFRLVDILVCFSFLLFLFVLIELYHVLFKYFYRQTSNYLLAHFLFLVIDVRVFDSVDLGQLNQEVVQSVVGLYFFHHLLIREAKFKEYLRLEKEIRVDNAEGLEVVQRLFGDSLVQLLQHENRTFLRRSHSCLEVDY